MKIENGRILKAENMLELLRHFYLSLEHKTCDILVAERLRLMRFDNRLIIDSLRVAFCSELGKEPQAFSDIKQ